MRKTTTKILAMVLAVVMLVGIAPVSAFAQETKPVGAEKQEERISAPLGEKENEKESEVIEHIAPVSVGDNTLAATGQCGDNVYWTFDEDTGELVIHGKGKMFNNGIGPFVSNSSIKSIKIESGVTSIGDSAFYNCRSLTSINIPDSVTSIGDQAFNYCISLTSIEIPDSVTSIGSYAFGSCSSLTSIEIPDSVTSIGEGAFRYCSSLTSINIPDNVTSIGSWAFDGCSSLTSVEIPDSVTSIGDYAFYNCSSLKSIEIPDSVTSIGDEAFAWCSSLTSIEIPDSVTYISWTAFSGCSSISDVYFHGTVKKWEKLSGTDHFGLDMDKVVVHIIFPSSGQCGDNVYWTFDEATGALNISGTGEMYNYGYGDSPFEDDSSIKSIIIEHGVTSIGNFAFYECTGLTSVTIPDSVTSIGNWAFYGCRSLTSVTIGNSVKSIGNGAFEDCSSLTSIEIPDSVTSIGDGAFYKCSSLTSVTIGDSVTSIGWYAFYNCSSLTSITIPDSVTSIGGGAFYDCSSLTSVTIGNSVTSIGDYAFYDCNSLKSVTIPDSVLNIESYAFYDCDITGELVIPSSVITVGYQAFEKNRNLETLTISEGVKTIGENAFALCESLKTVVIPWNVTGLHYGAFYGCSSITDVYYGGMKNEWNDLGGTEYFGLDMNNVVVHFTNVSSHSGKCGDNVSWSLNVETGVLTISGTGDMWDYEWDDSPFSYRTSIKVVTIQNSVTSIGVAAFEGCSSLTSIVIPDSVTSIGYDAFAYCNLLQSIEIPDSVTSIGNMTFAYCTGLTSVKIPDSVTSVGNGAFEDCSSLTSIEIPDSVTSIGYGVFNNCSSLTSITIPDSVTSIGDFAFWGCSSLTSIEIPDGVTSIGYEVFWGCRSLTSITIPESVTNIDDDAFYDCPDDMVIFGVPGSYAQTYAESNDILFVAVNGAPYVSIHCQPLTDTPDFTVYGVANLNTEISIYDGETLLTTAKSDSRGQWKTTVTLNNPANNSEHTIKAVVTKNGESKTVSSVVTYDVGAIFPTEFTLTHSGNTINLLTSKTKNLTIVPSNNFVFNVKLNKNVSSLKVTSTKNGATKSISATYNSATGTWTASGWFDQSNHSYAPGELGLEIDGTKVAVECAKINYLIDPSGYVYEAVKSNRVEGAGVIICYQDGEHAIPWDANPFEQENPQITDEMGAYHWDVTEGKWRVKVTKSGYNAAYSDWMQVPPEWTEVAIPLVTTQSPEVKSVEKGEDGYIITFNQYMDIDSVNSTNVVFENNDGTIAGTITPVNKEVSGTDSSVYYASVFKFVPTDANAQVNAATINNVKNYAGITISETFTQEFGGSTPEHDHIPGQTVKEKEVSPSCTARGSYDEVVYCTVCGEELSRQTIEVAALGHTEGEWVVTVQPTTSSEGTKELYCSVCGATLKTESIPKLSEQDLKVRSVSISDITVGYRSSAVITPTIDAVDGAKYNVTYKSNSSAVSVDQNGRVTSNKTFGFSPASATITITVTDTNSGESVSDTCTVSVQFSAIQWIIKIVLFGWIWY